MLTLGLILFMAYRLWTQEDRYILKDKVVTEIEKREERIDSLRLVQERQKTTIAMLTVMVASTEKDKKRTEARLDSIMNERIYVIDPKDRKAMIEAGLANPNLQTE